MTPLSPGDALPDANAAQNEVRSASFSAGDALPDPPSTPLFAQNDDDPQKRSDEDVARGAAAFEAMLNGRKQSASSPSSVPTHRHKAPPPSLPVQTLYKQAGAPPAAKDQDLTPGQVLQQAGQNFIPSLSQNLGGMWNAVTHPGDTLNALGNIGGGLVSQAAGALGVKQDPKKKAQDEALVKAVEDHYVNTYGSWKGFARSFAKDPTSVLMDLGTIADPVLGIAGRGLEAGSVASKALNAARTATRMTDPAQAAVGLAKTLGTTVKAPARFAAGVTTGVGAKPYDMAEAALTHSNPEVRKTYQAFVNGRAGPDDLRAMTSPALQDMRDEASAEYGTKLASMDPQAKPVDWTPVQAGLAKARAKTYIDPNAANPIVREGMESENAALDRLYSKLGDYMTSGANAPITALDNMRKDVKSVLGPKSESRSNPLMDVVGGIKEAAQKAHPDYNSMLSAYGQKADQIDRVAAAIGANSTLPANEMARMLASVRTGKNASLLQDLIRRDPRIGAALAGASLNPLGATHHGFIRGAADVGLGTLAGLAGASPIVTPLGAVAGLAASSPRVTGMANAAASHLGAGMGAVNSLKGHALTSGLDYASKPGDLQDEKPVAPEEPDAPDAPAGDVTQEQRHMQRVWGVESRGHQLNDNGTPVTSLKGAVGIGQMEPGAAQDAAKALGIPYDPDRLKTDAAYNAALSSAYHMMLLQRFNGDQAKADAAYNAGARRVEEAVRAAQEKGDHWLDHMPPETRQYVPKLNPPGTYKSGGGVKGGVGAGGAGEGVSHDETTDGDHDAKENVTDDVIEGLVAPPLAGHGVLDGLRTPVEAGDERKDGAKGDEVGPAPNEHIADPKQRRSRHNSDPPANQGIVHKTANMSSAAKHEYWVKKLMTRAKAARKEVQMETKPLLKTPDDAVVKALHIAQRAI